MHFRLMEAANMRLIFIAFTTFSLLFSQSTGATEEHLYDNDTLALAETEFSTDYTAGWYSPMPFAGARFKVVENEILPSCSRQCIGSGQLIKFHTPSIYMIDKLLVIDLILQRQVHLVWEKELADLQLNRLQIIPL